MKAKDKKDIHKGNFEMFKFLNPKIVLNDANSTTLTQSLLYYYATVEPIQIKNWDLDKKQKAKEPSSS